MPTLYEITNEIAQLVTLENDDGEMPVELAERLNSLQMPVSDKVHWLCKFMKQNEAEALAAQVEADRLREMQSHFKSKADWIKKYLFDCLTQAGIDRIDVPLFKLWIQGNGRPFIELRDGAEIPEQFKKVKVELDKEAAYKEWKAGKQLPDSLEVTTGCHLRIK